MIRANQTATTAGRPPLVQAVIVRGNRLEAGMHISPPPGLFNGLAGIRDVVVEANNTAHRALGLVVDRGVAFLAWPHGTSKHHAFGR